MSISNVHHGVGRKGYHIRHDHLCRRASTTRLFVEVTSTNCMPQWSLTFSDTLPFLDHISSQLISRPTEHGWLLRQASRTLAEGLRVHSHIYSAFFAFPAPQRPSSPSVPKLSIRLNPQVHARHPFLLPPRHRSLRLTAQRPSQQRRHIRDPPGLSRCEHRARHHLNLRSYATARRDFHESGLAGPDCGRPTGAGVDEGS